MEIGVKIWCDDIHIPKLRRVLKGENIIKIDDTWWVLTDNPEETKVKIDKYFKAIEHAK